MECHPHLVVALLLSVTVAIAGSHALAPAEEYWKVTFPRTPMPKSLRKFVTPANDIGATKSSYSLADLLASDHDIPDGQKNYGNPATTTDIYHIKEAVYFFERDLAVGKTMELKFSAPIQAYFISRQAADSIPYSSAKMPEILKYFSVKPNSKEAELLKSSVELCEKQPLTGEDRYCATSLESMVDFATTKLGKNIKVLSTEVDRTALPAQKFTILGVSRLLKPSSIACHKMKYPYAVHYCHESPDVRLYAVPLRAADGTTFTAYSVCHIDTSNWSPMHLAFQLLKVKPGKGGPICHFLDTDTLLWVPN